jgi:predicted ABC-type transport system involved in lysophospholipase L1 biosynthesis ATPase subunit
MQETILELRDATRVYSDGPAPVWGLRDVCLRIAPGETVAITGPSGSGKTTLLNVAAGTDVVTGGTALLFGNDLARIGESARTALRAHGVGLIFQDPHLLPGLTALENVVIAKLPWRRRSELEREARELLRVVGLEDRLDHAPARLSGGERQRVGIARALLGQPRLLLADEPTGNLDRGSKGAVLQVLGALHDELNFALVIVTHDDAVAAIAHRVLAMDDGRLSDTT